jgi:DNA topoisomerase-1
MKLVIVESPAKAKTIEKYLGKEYKVCASVGHVRDLPKSNKKAIDISAGFIPHYETIPGKEKVIKEIKSLATKADEVILATDPDREGEAIAWHVAEALGLKKPKRSTFNEITKDAVNTAIAHPRGIDEKLVSAQEARRVLDRLFGYDLSGLIWKKVRYGLSAGRVQSPALRIIMEREREIRTFVPEAYFVISADLTHGKNTVTFTCIEEPKDTKTADNIVIKGRAGSWIVNDVKETNQKRTPYPPFITSTLQQAASTRLGYPPAKTMQIAQKLYEAGHITYMRTDSPTLAKEAQAAILAHITSTYGNEKTAPRTYASKSKNAQEAHEAIRPTHIGVQHAGTTPEQKRLYALIHARTIASQMIDAELKKTKLIATINGGGIPDFAANGSRVIAPGWLLADPDARGEDVTLPVMTEGDTLVLKDITSAEKTTQPPGRYTEAGLVKELEKRGIGRPSTYAAIIKTLEDRGYVIREKRTLFPTDTGDVVSSFLEKHFGDYISDDFTAHMEDELDEIADGERLYTSTIKEFYGPFTKTVADKKDIEKLTTLGDADPEMKCPKCRGSMIIKLGKTGSFLSCAKFPDCDGARTMEGDEMTGPKETGELCPDCGGPLVERMGRYGKFISCKNYPKCKYIKSDPEEEARKRTGVSCPKCSKGEIIERRGRFGIFYSCSNYPDCKYAIKAKPTGATCPVCGELMIEGTKTIPERCSDKNCPNHNPHKLGN